MFYDEQNCKKNLLPLPDLSSFCIFVIEILVFDFASLPGFVFEILSRWCDLLIGQLLSVLWLEFRQKFQICLHVLIKPQADYFAYTVDIAGEESQCDAVSGQGRPLGEQHCLGELESKLNQLTSTFSQVILNRATLPVHNNSLIPWPDKFYGDPSMCKSFLLQCSLDFAGQTRLTDHTISQVTYRSSSQMGHGCVKEKWWVDVFLWSAIFCQVFEHTLKDEEGGDQLLTDEQGRWHAAQ